MYSFRQQREQLMAKFDKLEADNLKQKEEYEGKIYALEKNHIRYLYSLYIHISYWYTLTINLRGIYTAPCEMILMRANPL